MPAIRFTPPIRSTRRNDGRYAGGNGSTPPPPDATDPFFERSPPPDAVDQLLAHLERTEREHGPAHRAQHPAALRRRTPEELDADRRGAMRAAVWGVAAALIVIACVVIAGAVAAWAGYHAE